MYSIFLVIVWHVALIGVQDGTLDPSFGFQGQVLTPSPAGTQQIPRNIRIQSDGKILVGGRNNPGPCCFINRYNTDGSLDTSYGTNGHMVQCFPAAGFYAADMVLQSDDKSIVGILVPIGGNDVVVLARFLINGALDTTFGVNGFAQMVVGAGGASRMLLALAIQEDDKIVFVSSTSTTAEGIVGRFLPNGTVDSSFANNGLKIISATDFGGLTVNFFGVQIQHDGKIVIFGDMSSAFFNNNTETVEFGLIPDIFFVARLFSDGSFDMGFGSGGVAITNAGTGAAGGLVQSDGKILAYGSQSTPPLYVVRYLSNGQLDTTFATNGVGIYPLAGNISNMNCMGLQSDGKIVVANSFSVDGSANGLMFTAVRINTNGSVDASFGTNGYVNTFVLGQPNCQTFGCEVDTNGKIYIVGTVGNTQVGLVRYLVDSIIYGPLSKALAARYYNQTR